MFFIIQLEKTLFYEHHYMHAPFGIEYLAAGPKFVRQRRTVSL